MVLAKPDIANLPGWVVALVTMGGLELLSDSGLGHLYQEHNEGRGDRWHVVGDYVCERLHHLLQVHR